MVFDYVAVPREGVQGSDDDMEENREDVPATE